ncbi:hypothetical protein AZE42_04941 [Rhizopogon vesiculosus]|uniref:Uncharacterized protein n=1 Tax=Rhizopogon vesiculosus TaxID=180088 RepID=A0A1J8QGT3_9AGAM|nr:hypothetical protein AZE42_04941 [Rhizopogon vesiculosus]
MPANSTNSSAKTELQGFELAKGLFAPLLNPIAATQSAWNNYSINRLRTTKNGTLLSKSSEEDEEDEDEYDEDVMVEWFYTLGYKIQRRPPGEAADVSAIEKELVKGAPPVVHTRNGWGTRLLLAAAGISYGVACTNDEMDERSRDYMLEGLSDKWVARGMRNACGFQLKRDAEEAREGAQERKEEGEGRMYFDYSDEDEDDDEDDFSF